MTAVCHPITIEQGATFRLPLRWRDDDGSYRDLSAYEALFVIANADGSNFVSLTHADGVHLDDAGWIIVEISDEMTAEFEQLNGRRYNLELTSPTGDVLRLLQGPVYISKRVPR